MTLAVAVLMKDPAEAKSRLRPVLGDAERSQLALGLFCETLAFFRRAFPDLSVGVVTPSAEVRRLAERAGAQALCDVSGAGINEAAGTAARWALDLGMTSLLVIHADIPDLLRHEVVTLLALHASHAVVVAESADGGTNALIVSPPDRIRFRFGPGSALAHQHEASKAGVSFVRATLPGLAHDLDTPVDLDRRSGMLRRLRGDSGACA